MRKPNFIIESGYKLNNITVLYTDENKKLWYICQCDCGNIKSISGKKLREGVVKTCGYCVVNKIKPGEQYYYFTAINKDPKQKFNWICKCKCGKEISVKAYRLLSKTNRMVSCGCAIYNKHNDIYTGKTFNKLYIVKQLDRDNSKRRVMHYQYQCECGNEGKIAYTSIGKTISCGCVRTNPNNYKEMSGMYWDRLKTNAVKRNIEFNLTQEYVYSIFIRQNKRCGITNVEIGFSNQKNKTTASLDRIDNNKGYIEGNVQWLHKYVNMMKRTLPNYEIIDFFKNVADNYIRESKND